MNIDGVILTKLKIIENDKGNIYHVLKKNDIGYNGFGEVYFSTIMYNCVKAWKKHFEMTLNLIVPFGEVKFVLYDDRDDSLTKDNIMEVNLSLSNYCRLTIAPKIWLGFQGLSEGVNLIQNVSNLLHDPNEQLNVPIDKFHLNYSWE